MGYNSAVMSFIFRQMNCDFLVFHFHLEWDNQYCTCTLDVDNKKTGGVNEASCLGTDSNEHRILFF